VARPLHLETGTAAPTTTIQAVTTVFVYVHSFLLLGLELRARRRTEPSILGPAETPSGLGRASMSPASVEPNLPSGVAQSCHRAAGTARASLPRCDPSATLPGWRTPTD
jgi:hypothetical protein